MNQLATQDPIHLPDFKPEFADEEVRQYPQAQYSFLRFQIVRKIDRPMIEPRYEGRKLVGTFRNGRRISTAKLIGFGETLKSAKAMAAKEGK